MLNEFYDTSWTVNSHLNNDCFGCLHPYSVDAWRLALICIFEEFCLFSVILQDLATTAIQTMCAVPWMHMCFKSLTGITMFRYRCCKTLYIGNAGLKMYVMLQSVIGTKKLQLYQKYCHCISLHFLLFRHVMI